MQHAKVFIGKERRGGEKHIYELFKKRWIMVEEVLVQLSHLHIWVHISCKNKILKK